MDTSYLISKMNEYMFRLNQQIGGWLEKKLPKITDDWWQDLVFNNLSPLQRETVLRNDIHEIKGLDLAALLRVLDRNWFVITSTFFINNKERGNIRTMQEIRNTWAHITPNDISKARVIDDVNVIFALMQAFDASMKDTRDEKCLRISKLGDPVFLRDLLTYKVRQLDLEYIGRLGELHFVQEHKNLIIWGAPGTGKTWMAKAVATKACQEGIRTRWVTYPFLCRELMRLKAEDSRKLEARIKYYCGFDLFCIDEFPNYDIEDKFLMQEFFNQAKIAGHSTIVSGQCSPENWDSLFEVKSFAQSIRGRLLEHAYRLELKGPDLRTYTPDVP